MSKYETRDNSGALFKNTDKQKETHADYRGNARIGGVDYFMDAWIKTSDSGRTWMSFSFKEKEQQAAPAPRPAAKTHGDRPGGPKNRRDEFPADEDIPF